MKKQFATKSNSDEPLKNFGIKIHPVNFACLFQRTNKYNRRVLMRPMICLFGRVDCLRELSRVIKSPNQSALKLAYQLHKHAIDRNLGYFGKFWCKSYLYQDASIPGRYNCARQDVQLWYNWKFCPSLGTRFGPFDCTLITI